MVGWRGCTFWSPRAPVPRPVRLILRVLATICLLALLPGAGAHLRAGAAAAPWMKPTLTLTAMTVAIGGLLIIDGGVRRASGGLRMPEIGRASCRERVCQYV